MSSSVCIQQAAALDIGLGLLAHCNQRALVLPSHVWSKDSPTDDLHRCTLCDVSRKLGQALPSQCGSRANLDMSIWMQATLMQPLLGHPQLPPLP